MKSLWWQLNPSERRLWLERHPAEAAASRDGEDPPGVTSHLERHVAPEWAPAWWENTRWGRSKKK